MTGIFFAAFPKHFRLGVHDIIQTGKEKGKANGIGRHGREHAGGERIFGFS